MDLEINQPPDSSVLKKIQQQTAHDGAKYAIVPRTKLREDHVLVGTFDSCRVSDNTPEQTQTLTKKPKEAVRQS